MELADQESGCGEVQTRGGVRTRGGPRIRGGVRTRGAISTGMERLFTWVRSSFRFANFASAVLFTLKFQTSKHFSEMEFLYGHIDDGLFNVRVAKCNQTAIYRQKLEFNPGCVNVKLLLQ